MCRISAFVNPNCTVPCHPCEHTHTARLYYMNITGKICSKSDLYLKIPSEYQFVFCYIYIFNQFVFTYIYVTTKKINKGRIREKADLQPLSACTKKTFPCLTHKQTLIWKPDIAFRGGGTRSTYLGVLVYEKLGATSRAEVFCKMRVFVKNSKLSPTRPHFGRHWNLIQLQN